MIGASGSGGERERESRKPRQSGEDRETDEIINK